MKNYDLDIWWHDSIIITIKAVTNRLNFRDCASIATKFLRIKTPNYKVNSYHRLDADKLHNLCSLQ